MKIDLIDLKQRFAEEKTEILACLEDVLDRGSLVLTEEVSDFEKSICDFTNSKFCLGLNSGTDALMMSLWSNGIGKGDEVITSNISFIASVGAIAHVGAIPILVDVRNDLNIDPEKIESKITNKTKAIMPVHWTGRICEMDKIKNLANKYNLIIIEDAAQAIGSFYKGTHAGSFGSISAYSAHPLKNLNAIGDAGYVTTNDEQLYDKIKLYRNHGLESRDNVAIFGVNSRLDSLNAKILSFRLTKLKSVIAKRQHNVSLYRKNILTDKVQIPEEHKFLKNSYVMFICICENRDKLKLYLDEKGIQSLIYYNTPLHLHKASKSLGYKYGDFPISENLCSKVLAFPHHQYLKEYEIEYICEHINKFYS
jgi:dTDP-4-amino-4,6-dideoxygalactose transaminase